MTRRHLRTMVSGLLALAVAGCDTEAAESAKSAPPPLEMSPYRRDSLTETQMARTRVLQQTCGRCLLTRRSRC
jgi:hypothetical protein